ncbi:nucleotidyltransferase family protein [Aridibaculum aurantiacum]|uniref:nucleotidyltransferase family protein n=1 Tax=Aridibaculum aurantiacum TaxID=2810307 RepID=UPI001A9615DB|nr:nucleotidyltransferase family protein [Aridibaculum aurantiacum]
MAETEAIILAGGLGTRLRSAVPDLPKCMAPVNGEPFLKYVLDYLLSQEIEHYIFALGYKHEAIEAYIQKAYPRLMYKVSLEEEPLGTGGAILQAMKMVKGKHALVTNGDTLFKGDVHYLLGYHKLSGSECSLALKPMNNFDRYGVVETDKDNRIINFKEKQYYEQGNINAGMYALHKKKFLQEDLPKKFSFEKDYLEALYHQRRMYGIVQHEYFIDIGIPEDYERAQHELQQ